MPTLTQEPLTPNSGRCYLVTGVAGFIASKVAEQLLAAGHTVVGVDNLNDYYDVRLKLYRLGRLARQAGVPEAEVRRYGLDVQSEKSSAHLTPNKEPITLKSDRFEFHALDIEDLPALERVFERSDFAAVFNLAARAGVRYSIEFPELYRRTNVLGEENVLKCQVKYGVKKHVLASSSSVYAGCPMPFVEDAVLGKMQSPYAETKRQAELLALDYHQKHGIDVTALRYFTVFGPAGRPDMAPFRFIKWIDEGTPITLYGDGSQARDFTYVDDIARGTILAGRLFGGQIKPETGNLKPEGSDLKASLPSTQVSGFRSQVSESRSQVSVEAPRFDIVNLGGGNNPITLHTMIGWIEKALDEQRAKSEGQSARSYTSPLPLGPSPAKARINAQPPSPADMDKTWADISKAGRLLGWKPETSPAEGFQKTVDWYLENRGWLSGIKL